MIIIGRHINGITINPLEYLLDDQGNEMQFESEEKAKDFLKEHGYTDDEIYWFTFVDLDELEAQYFEKRMIKIPGIDKGMIENWVNHAFGMAILGEQEGVPQSTARMNMLELYAETFEKIESFYNSETAAAIFNYKAGYVAHELYGAAKFISKGGDPVHAFEMASNGAFESYCEPGKNETPSMTMQ